MIKAELISKRKEKGQLIADVRYYDPDDQTFKEVYEQYTVRGAPDNWIKRIAKKRKRQLAITNQDAAHYDALTLGEIVTDDLPDEE